MEKCWDKNRVLGGGWVEEQSRASAVGGCVGARWEVWVQGGVWVPQLCSPPSLGDLPALSLGFDLVGIFGACLHVGSLEILPWWWAGSGCAPALLCQTPAPSSHGHSRWGFG